MRIKDIKAIEILDSRGYPTIRTFVFLENGIFSSSSVPSGASTGSHEAVELRDNDQKRYHGKGVLKAVDNVNQIISKKLIGLKAERVDEIDKIMIELDGKEDKSNLGANAILSVSQALIKTVSLALKMPLWQFINQFYFQKKPSFPRLMVNIVNGGRHAGFNFDIQEFIISPTSKKPSESVRVASEIFHQLGKNLKEKGLSTLVGDEGGYSPYFSKNEEVFEEIIEASKKLGYENGKDYQLAIDAAASEFFLEGKYFFRKTNKKLSTEELTSYYLSLIKNYQVFSFEDPFGETDWEGFEKFTQISGAQVVGDDLYTTDKKLIKKGIEKKTTNAVLIKPNQIGTIFETVEAIKLAQKAGLKIVISHRSGETEDSFIADLAYGGGADFIKTGSTSRSERLAKYNRLIEIENHL